MRSTPLKDLLAVLAAVRAVMLAAVRASDL
jgi:hypothetical protein